MFSKNSSLKFFPQVFFSVLAFTRNIRFLEWIQRRRIKNHPVDNPKQNYVASIRSVSFSSSWKKTRRTKNSFVSIRSFFFKEVIFFIRTRLAVKRPKRIGPNNFFLENVKMIKISERYFLRKDENFALLLLQVYVSKVLACFNHFCWNLHQTPSLLGFKICKKVLF